MLNSPKVSKQRGDACVVNSWHQPRPWLAIKPRAQQQRKGNGCWWPLDVAERSRRLAVLVMMNRTIWCAGKSVPENNFCKRLRKKYEEGETAWELSGSEGASIDWNVCIKSIFWFSRNSSLDLTSSCICCSEDFHGSSSSVVFPGEQSQYLHLSSWTCFSDAHFLLFLLR